MYKRMLPGLKGSGNIILVASDNMIRESALSCECISIYYPLKALNIFYRFLIEQLLIPVLGILNNRNLLVMMGNFPCLIWFSSQVVFFHNTLYLKKHDSGDPLRERIEAALFCFMIRLKKPIVVAQTNLVRQMLLNKFPCLEEIRVSGVPTIEASTNQSKDAQIIYREGITIVYPAYFYPHKNHHFLLKMSNYFDKLKVKIIFTIDEDSIKFTSTKKTPASSPFKFVGSITSHDLKCLINESDAVIFVSLNESLGMPLLEACEQRIPVIAPNLPYVKAAIAHYYEFNLESPLSLVSALKAFISDHKNQQLRLPHSDLLVKPSEFISTLIS